MQTGLKVVSATFPVFDRLGQEIRKYQDRRKIKDQLLDVLGDDVRAFMGFYQEIITIAETRLIPILDSLEKSPSKETVNRLVDCDSDFLSKYTALLQCFIELAHRCNEVLANPAFIKHLGETTRLLHDFVVRMADVVENDSIKIDNRFYVFFKLYSNELFRSVRQKDVETAIDKMRVYIRTIKGSLKPLRVKVLLNKIVRKKFIRSYKEFIKLYQKMKIQQTKVIDLINYVPSKFIPVVTLLDEAVPLESILRSKR